MIDWWSVVANSLWILGASVILAAFSYYAWVASNESSTLTAQLEKPTFALVFFLGLGLIGLGLLGTGDGILQRGMAALLVAGSVFAVVRVYRLREKKTPSR